MASRARSQNRSAAAHKNELRGVYDLLVGLATVLTPSGITPHEFGELARRAFVEVAARESRFRNGRPNHSKIAALTGLTRAEVKRLLQSQEPIAHGKTSRRSCIERVILGWTTDERFTKKAGVPRELAVAEGRASFAHLVRQYGGDVPYRAVLDQMKLLKLVVQRGNALRLRLPRLGQLRNKLTRVSAVAPLLVDSLEAVLATEDSGKRCTIRQLVIPIRDRVALALAEKRVGTGAQSFLHGLEESLHRLPTPHAERQSAHSLRIAVLITAGSNNFCRSRSKSTEVKKNGRK